jgi:hypothetical protein
LFAVDFNPCYQKNSRSIYEIDGINCVGISQNKLLCHDPEDKIKDFKGNKVYIYDEFNKVYILKTTKKLNFIHLKDTNLVNLKKEVALIDKKGYQISHIIKMPNYYTSFGKINNNSYNKIIGIKCYKVIGIGTLNSGFLTSNYIEKMIKKRDNFFGDVGIRVKQINGKFVVYRRDIYFDNNPFVVGDEIISINGKKFKTISSLVEKILFSKYGDVLKFRIKRGGKLLSFSVKVDKRYGSGYLKDTFLERFGIILDKNLTIKKIIKNSYSHRHGLKVGDRILALDRVGVSSFDKLKEIISNKKDKYSSFLIDRDGFQFFFTIGSKNAKRFYEEF